MCIRCTGFLRLGLAASAICIVVSCVAAQAADSLFGSRWDNGYGFQIEFSQVGPLIGGSLTMVPKDWKKRPGKGAQLFLSGKQEGNKVVGMWRHWTNECKELGPKAMPATIIFKDSNHIEVNTANPLYSVQTHRITGEKRGCRWLDESNPEVIPWKRVAGSQFNPNNHLISVTDFTGHILKPSAPGKKPLFEQLDKDGNGCLTQDELNQAVADPKYQGKDVEALILLSKRGDMANSFSGDSCSDGISKEDVNRQTFSEDSQTTIQDNLVDIRAKGDKSKGALFGPGDAIKPEAVKQGWVGDCNFLSPLSSFADTPEGKKAIREMITPMGKDEHGIDRYKVTFHDPKNPGKTFDVIVTKPTQGELTSFAKGTENGIWPAVIEKAYGTWRQDHDQDGNLVANSLAPGSSPTLAADRHNTASGAITLLTGKKPENKYISSPLTRAKTDLAELDADLTKAFSGKKPIMTAGIEDEGKGVTGTVVKWFMQPAGGVKDGVTKASGLQAGHEFSVLGYDPASKKVKIRNPYGYNNAKDPALMNKDGVFEMSLSDFRKNFSHYTYTK